MQDERIKPISSTGIGNEQEEKNQAEDTPVQSNLTMIVVMTALLFFAIGGLAAYVAFGMDDEGNDGGGESSAALQQTATVGAAVDNADATSSSIVQTLAPDDENAQATLQAVIESQVNAAIEATLFALTPTATPPPTAVPEDFIVSDESPFLGAEDAPIVIVEFSDYQCPYCGRFDQQTRDPLIEHYGDLVKLVFRDYPVIGGQSSAETAEAARCAGLQGLYWEYSDLIWENQALPSGERLTLNQQTFDRFAEQVEGLDMDEFDQCLADDSGWDLVVADFNMGQTLGVRSTPSFFINGRPFTGAQPLQNFIAVIDAELVRMGIEPPERES